MSSIIYTTSIIGGTQGSASIHEPTIRPNSTNINVFVDELSCNTESLLTTSVVTKIIWDNREHFNSLVIDFGVNIKESKVPSQEWGQDLVKQIRISNEEFTFEIVARNKFNLINELKSIFTEYIFNLITLSDNSNEYNLTKGGNFINLPEYVSDSSRDKMKSIITLKSNNQLISITDITNKYSPYISLKVYLPNFEIDTYTGTCVFHIDEILTLIPTGLGKDDYDIWFYNPICSESESFQKELVTIQRYNLQILYEFFPSSRIKLFDLNFDENGYIKEPPLFNRVILRKDNTFRIIFPDQENTVLKQQITNQLDEYNLNQSIHIDYHFIDTTQLHRENGNIHCGYKAIPVIPIL